MPGLANGTFSWVKTTLTLPDSHLLLLAGFDAYVFLKSLKLMFIMMLFFAILGMTVLLPTYYYGGSSKAHYYIRMCIRNISNAQLLWVPFVVMVVASVFIFYSIYIFYRNFVVARQAYLKSPSTFQALNKIEGYTDKLRSYQQSLKFFDVLNRSIIITGMSSTYSKERIQAIFADMKLGDIQSIFIAKDRSLIAQRLKRLNGIHERLERLYCSLFRKLRLAALVARPDLPDELAKLEGGLLSNAEIKGLFEAVNSPAFYPAHREEFTTKDKTKVDAIQHFSGKLVAAQEEMDEMVRHYMDDQDSQMCSPLPYNQTADTEDQDLYDENASLITFKGLGMVKANITDFKLTLWGTSSSAIIIFADWKSATIASQTLLSARPFSFAVQPAPMANEVDWDNLYMPTADRSLRFVLGELLYVVVNIGFSIFQTMLVKLLELSTLERLLPFLGPLFREFPKLRELVTGVLKPLAFSISLLLIPYVLLVLTYYQAYIDKVDAQLTIMNKYSWMLFLQTFVVVVAGPLDGIVRALYAQDLRAIFKALDENAAMTSSLFFNIILQKALIGLMVRLTKPADLLLALGRRMLAIHLTPRAKRDLDKPTALPLGFLYPEYAVIVFQTALSFSIITPLILVVGTLFFGMAYFIFRAQLIYADKISHESGGMFWPSLTTHLLFALLLAQFFALIQFVSLGGNVQAFLTLPLLMLTIFGMVTMRLRFTRRVGFIALSGEAQEPAMRLIQEQNKVRETVMRRAGPSAAASAEIPADSRSEATADPQQTVRTCDTFIVDSRIDALEDARPRMAHESEELIDGEPFDRTDNPYTNPVVFQRLRTLMLPLHFFSLIRCLREHPL